MRRIGVLMTTAEDARTQAFAAAFVERLKELGWTDGGNVHIDIRWGHGDVDRIRNYATELVALIPDVILATGSGAVAPLLKVTRSILIEFVIVPDPVGCDFESLAHPGGNATGFLMFEYAIGAKWLELLKEIAPPVTRVAVIRDATITGGIGQWGAIRQVCVRCDVG